MPESFFVRIAKAEHVFSAAHFIVLAGNCERLHGHNYRVVAEVAGSLDDDGLVVDFLVLRDELRRIVAELDHFLLLPTEHRELHVVDDGRSVKVTFEDRHWEFPRGDCRLLPVANTTAELLAAHIGRKLQLVLEQRFGLNDAHLRIELDECEGQWAVWEWQPT